MYRFFLAAMDMLPGALLLAPIYWLLNRIYFRDGRKSCIYFLFSCYLSAVYVLVGLPNITYIRPGINLNLVPIIGIVDDLKNSFLNILLFMPLGFLLPILWDKFRLLRSTLLFSFCTSLAIELLQLLTYRTTDVNDLITNTLGAYLGFLCAKILLKRFPQAGKGTACELAAIFSTVVAVMFFLYPFVSSALWDLILS